MCEATTFIFKKKNQILIFKWKIFLKTYVVNTQNMYQNDAYTTSF